jgi:hypothetical protein
MESRANATDLRRINDNQTEINAFLNVDSDLEALQV